MSNRKITQIISAQEVTEGAGVSVFRSIGTRARRNLDPFVMLDQFSTDNPDDYIAGFPDHPHRGFNTFTYMIDGHMRHGDSMGNRGDLGPGGAQWMKAGSGVIHSEMPQQESGRMRGFQLWINLPADQKMTAPEYQDVPPEAIAEVKNEISRVRVVAGAFNGIRGPVTDPNTGFQFLDVTLSADNDFVHRLARNDSAFLYLFEGSASVGDTEVKEQQLAVLGEGEQVSVTADGNGARFLLVAGRVIGEPIVQYGPFVMNTREEIEQALADYRDGKLVQMRANMIVR
ncbi:MAG: pirin family protein [Gammaproteobacteria bacterium]|nr:pirin family protein [Gammaproteobacteria bacterium]NNJ96901.1 pirin family protein [Gammaproteobacteria bacterium]